MAKSQSTRAARPAKPRPDFPLYPRRAGQWAKKIKRRLCCFAPWSDPDGAPRRYLSQKKSRNDSTPWELVRNNLYVFLKLEARISKSETNTNHVNFGFNADERTEYLEESTCNCDRIKTSARCDSTKNAGQIRCQCTIWRFKVPFGYQRQLNLP